MSVNLYAAAELERKIKNSLDRINGRFVMEVILKEQENPFRVEFELREIVGNFYTNTIGKYIFMWSSPKPIRYLEIEKGINANLIYSLDRVARLELKRRRKFNL